MPTRLLKRLYETEGLTLRQIADRFWGYSSSGLSSPCDAGIKFRAKGGPRHPLTRKELYRLYVTEGLNIRETAERFGVSSKFISKQLKRHQIERRSVWDRESHRIDRALLYKLYVKDGLTQIETAEQLGTTVKIVHSELKRHRITFRHKTGVGPATYQFTYDELYKLYHDEGLGCTKVGKRFGMNRHIVLYQLIRLGIERRPPLRGRGSSGIGT